MFLRLKGDSHRPNHVNFSQSWVDITLKQVNSVAGLHDNRLFCSSGFEFLVLSQSNLEVVETFCRDGQWHVERCLPTSMVQCFTLLKKTMISLQGMNQYLENSQWDSCTMLFGLVGSFSRQMFKTTQALVLSQQLESLCKWDQT
jgi:hypothetical protein